MLFIVRYYVNYCNLKTGRKTKYKPLHRGVRRIVSYETRGNDIGHRIEPRLSIRIIRQTELRISKYEYTRFKYYDLEYAIPTVFKGFRMRIFFQNFKHYERLKKF